MSRFAPVMPIAVAEKFQQYGKIGNYQLLLAHDVVKYPNRYHDVYGDIVHPGDVGMPCSSHEDSVVIMDNSVIELGKSIDPHIMLDAVCAVNANVVVLEDVLLDARKTVTAVSRSLDYWHEAIDRAGDCMVVPQGHDLSSWIWCLERLARFDYIGWIGIPKNLNEKLGISRREAIDYVSIICPDKYCHLLGFSDDLRDDVMSAIYGWQKRLVLGIDSAAPIWSGMRDNHFLTLSRNIPNKRGTWFDSPSGEVEQGIRNYDIMVNWLQDGSGTPVDLGDNYEYEGLSIYSTDPEYVDHMLMTVGSPLWDNMVTNNLDD